MAFRDDLWAVAEPIYQKTLVHPFVTGLLDATLPDDRFRYYVVQDYRYLQGFSRTLAQIASNAPSDVELQFFASSAANVVDVEHQLHKAFLAGFGMTTADLNLVSPSPTTSGYLDFMRANASDYADGVAAVLACYWIYREVGVTLLRQGSPDARFQRWIHTYGEEAFVETVERLLTIVDHLGEVIGSLGRARFQQLWLRGCQYEWLFFDAAWRTETWSI
ncbi:MAG TPA: thiaminase II [Jatrophihabitantaceae bacterium]|jgi:thiaminase/transcriptional activator TenA|nr:thiaminase II [Jatrophihabitantaceae bacterium]